MEILFPAQTSLQIWAGSCPIKIWLGVPLSLFNLSIFDRSIWFRYTDLEIKISLYLSIGLFWCFYKPMPLHPFLLWLIPILTSISSCIARSIDGLLSGSVLHFFNHLMSSPLIHNAIGILYPLLFVNHALYRAWVIYSWSLWYMVLRCPDGLDLCIL
jgi:hypothetical protein